MSTSVIADKRALSKFIQLLAKEILPNMVLEETTNPHEISEASLRKSHLKEEMQKVCPHEYADGQSAWVCIPQSECAICHVRD